MARRLLTMQEESHAAKEVMGLVAGKPRITLVGMLYVLLYLGLPVAALGALLDLGIQLVFGVCVGLWCVF